MSKATVSELISTYNNFKGDKELEVRLKNVNQESFFDMLKSFEKTPAVLEYSINIINDRNNEIRQLKFNPVNLEKISDTAVRKQRLMYVPVKGTVNYVVSAAAEEKIIKASLTANPTARFKIRQSFEHIREDRKWRVDFTIVAVTNSIEALPGLKTKFFPINPDRETVTAVFTAADASLIDSYEVEIEYNDSRPPTVADVENLVNNWMTSNTDVNKLKYQEIIYEIAKHIVKDSSLSEYKHRLRLKNLANQTITLSKKQYYEMFPPLGWYITEKADGNRCLIYGAGGRLCLVADKLLEFNIETKNTDVFIADAELIEEGPHAGLYIFDCMWLNEDLSLRPFSERLKYLSAAADKCNLFLSLSGKFTASAKRFIKITADLERDFREVFDAKYNYDIDGIILTDPSNSYRESVNYKWKPPAKNTIDFLCMSCPKELINIAPFMPAEGKNIYILFVGINSRVFGKLNLNLLLHYDKIFPNSKNLAEYFPIQFSVSYNPVAYVFYHSRDDLGGKIVELRCINCQLGAVVPEWELIRVRDDRKMELINFGNDYRVAELNYSGYIDPFLFEDLYVKKSGYFGKTADSVYVAANNYKRFVISTLVKRYANEVIVDLASGRGADLHRYEDAGVKHALFVDIDKQAVNELIQRKFDLMSNKKRPRPPIAPIFGGNPYGSRDLPYKYGGRLKIFGGRMSVNTLIGDLKDTKKVLSDIVQFPGFVANTRAVFCNFALHYMCDTHEHLLGVLELVKSLLLPGGVFIFTVMDGEKIHKLLADIKKGESWSAGEPIKYQIRKDYDAAKLEKYGQKIAVRLPFSDELYQEPLANIDAIIADAKKVGMSVELRETFAAWFDDFARSNPAKFEQLTPEDKHYIGIHSLVVLKL